MKALAMILLMLSGPVIQEVREKEEDRQLLMMTNLSDGLLEHLANIGLSFRFSRHWSISVEAGVNPEKFIYKKNEELEKHNAELDRDRKEDHIDETPLLFRHSRLGVSYWPVPDDLNLYLSAFLSHSPELKKTDLLLGAGYEIPLSTHLVCRIEAAAGLDGRNKKLNDCLAVRIGYRF